MPRIADHSIGLAIFRIALLQHYFLQSILDAGIKQKGVVSIGLVDEPVAP